MSIYTYDKSGPTVSALYVEEGGVYDRLADCWGVTRNALLYAGSNPVVGHPPCTAWGVWARQGHTHCALAEDDGTFFHCLSQVRTWGGVMEHPAYSSAWGFYHLRPPPYHGGWVPADTKGGFTCHVEQGHYGHPCRKPTWLYAHGCTLPDLMWGHSDNARGYAALGHRERAATPIAFAKLLLGMAQTVRRDAL